MLSRLPFHSSCSITLVVSSCLFLLLSVISCTLIILLFGCRYCSFLQHVCHAIFSILLWLLHIWYFFSQTAFLCSFLEPRVYQKHPLPFLDCTCGIVLYMLLLQHFAILFMSALVHVVAVLAIFMSISNCIVEGFNCYQRFCNSLTA